MFENNLGAAPFNVPWPWCEECRSYHHPENPTCFKLQPNRLQLAQQERRISEQQVRTITSRLQLGAINARGEEK